MNSLYFLTLNLKNKRALTLPNLLAKRVLSVLRFEAEVSFQDTEFNDNVFLAFTIFGGNASFVSASFQKYAFFDNTVFNGNVYVDRAIFRDISSWTSTKFQGLASFILVTFSGNALFSDARFICTARFDAVRFKGYANFNHAFICGIACFEASNAESAFTLGHARFWQVPDFSQAHFAEAPRLDDVQVPESGFWKILVKTDADTAARYRALKRMAIHGHDHMREQDFFAGELKAARGYHDKWWHARWWFGWLYQFLSDFGRSMVRPIGGWAFAVAGFACAYLPQHAWRAAGQNCIVGSGEACSAAIGLSLRKALPFPGIGSAEKLNQIYACLYGIHGQPGPGGALPERFSPVIPDAVDYLGIGQTLLSLLLLFLFLLAVRNHFRIK